MLEDPAYFQLSYNSEQRFTRGQINSMFSKKTEGDEVKYVEMTYEEMMQQKVEREREERLLRIANRHKRMMGKPVEPIKTFRERSIPLPRKPRDVEEESIESDEPSKEEIDSEYSEESEDDNYSEPEYAYEIRRDDIFSKRMVNLSNEISIEGNIVYRFAKNQLELEGQWSIPNETVFERFSYKFETPAEGFKVDSDLGTFNLCIANLHCALMLDDQQLFKKVLEYISGSYAGFFLYFGKTIEERVDLQIVEGLSGIEMNGEGLNSLGSFKMSGKVEINRTTEEMKAANFDFDSEVINLGTFQSKKKYSEFNPRENSRVIKSYHHRRERRELY